MARHSGERSKVDHPPPRPYFNCGAMHWRSGAQFSRRKRRTPLPAVFLGASLQAGTIFRKPNMQMKRKERRLNVFKPKLCLRKLYQPKKDEVFVKKQNYLFNCLLGKFEKLSTSYKMNLIEQFIKSLHV